MDFNKFMDINESIELDRKRTEVLYEQSLPTIVASIVAAIILVVILSGEIANKVLLTWFTIFLVLSASRIYGVYQYKYSLTRFDNHDLWLRRYILGAFLSGMMWGATGFMFVPKLDIMYTAFVTMCVSGLLAGSIPSYSVYHSVYYGFNIPAITPFIIYLISVNRSQYYLILLLLGFYVGFMFFIELRTHKMLLNLLKLKFDTMNLMLNLDEKQQETMSLHKKWEDATNKFYFLQKDYNEAKSRINELEEQLDLKQMTEN